MLLAVALLAALLPSPPTGWPTDSPPQPLTGPAGTVRFSIKPCPRIAQAPSLEGWVTYSIWDGSAGGPLNWNLEKTIAWKSDRTTAFNQSFRVPVGLYRYEVAAVAGKYPRELQCSTYFFIAVLPNDTRIIDDEMYDGVEDPLAQMFVYGLVPAGAEVKVFRFTAKQRCGEDLSAMPRVPIDTQRSAQGYYARYGYGPEWEGSRPRTLVWFAVQVTARPGEASRTFEVSGSYPRAYGADLALRYDITAKMLVRAHKANVLLCPCPSM